MIWKPNISWRHARRSITITWEEGGQWTGNKCETKKVREYRKSHQAKNEIWTM